MSTILIEGFNGNLLITEGYSGSQPVIVSLLVGGGAPSRQSFPKPKPRISPNVLTALLSYLTFKVTK